MVKAALYQMSICWEDKETNCKKAEKQMERAGKDGADLFLLPEMSFTGFSMHTDVTKEKDEQTIKRMRDCARRYHMAVGFGWVKDCGEKSENHYTVVGKNGEVLSDYVKIHPFSYMKEDAYFQGGSKLSYFSLNGLTCSLFLCYDLRFPEIFRIASDKSQVLIVAANWPEKRAGHWKSLLQARAVENQVYVLAVNCVGAMDGLLYTGDSCVIGPEGTVLCSLSGEEGLLEWSLTPEAVREYRHGFPVWQDRKEELYEALRKDRN